MDAPPPLTDGSYDAFILDAVDVDGGIHVDVTVVAGEHKGEVVAFVGPTTLGDSLDLMGMPATLTVIDGLPSLVVDA